MNTFFKKKKKKKKQTWDIDNQTAAVVHVGLNGKLGIGAVYCHARDVQLQGTPVFVCLFVVCLFVCAVNMATNQQHCTGDYLVHIQMQVGSLGAGHTVHAEHGMPTQLLLVWQGREQ